MHWNWRYFADNAGFSKVFLARKKATGKFYALKLMEKEGLS